MSETVEACLVADEKKTSRKPHLSRFKPGAAPGPGRPKGVPNKLTIGLREAVEAATQPGQCHPQGFAGWLVDRARGGVEDRKIFAGVVSRVIPLQVNAKSEGSLRIELGWLTGRDVGRRVAQQGQVIELNTLPENDRIPAVPSDDIKDC
jgi:hypothetical protein